MPESDQIAAEIDAMKREYEWLLEFEGTKSMEGLESILLECCKRLPSSNKMTAYGIQGSATLGVQTEKLVMVSKNTDAVRCTVTLLGDNIVHAELNVKYPKAPGHVLRTTCQPDTQWKLAQILDATNCVLLAINLLRADARRLSCLSAVTEQIQNARTALLLPRKRSLLELHDFRPNKCFTPALPPDLLLSIYVSASKLVCAAYHVQTPTATSAAGGTVIAAGAQSSFQVHQGEVAVPWLADLLSLLNTALQICQQLEGKLRMFADCKELQVDSPNEAVTKL